MADTGIRPGEVIEIGSREGVVNAVAEGMGVAIMFDEGPLPQDRVVKLGIRGCEIVSDVDVVCLSERRDTPIIKNFLLIAQQARSRKASRPAAERPIEQQETP
jgi:hypothetical protein